MLWNFGDIMWSGVSYAIGGRSILTMLKATIRERLRKAEPMRYCRRTPELWFAHIRTTAYLVVLQMQNQWIGAKGNVKVMILALTL